jgi:uncharacterized repeat protein (TIGR01451 family)
MRLRLLLALSLLVFGVLAPGAHAVAQGPQPADVAVTTPYPAIQVEAGETATFTITVISSARQRVDLQVEGVPDGWTTVLRGGGFVIDGVTTDPDQQVTATLDVTSAPDAGEGVTDLAVVADAEDGSRDTLPLTLRVSEIVAGEVSLETDFSTLQGPSDATFQFDVTLTNATPEEATFGLAATGPPGWSVTATPTTEAQATTATVAGGESTTIQVQVDPPDDAAAGTYEVVLRATGAGGSAELPLTVELTGNPELTLSTLDERLNAEVTVGQTDEVALLVSNDGTAPLSNVTLSATPPTGWEVTFEPETIAAVQPGEFVEVRALVTPASDTVAGDYLLPISASGDEGASGSVEIRTTVNRSSAAGIVGIALIGAALLALTAIFRRFGRR